MRKQPITWPCWTSFPIHYLEARRTGERAGSAMAKLLPLAPPAVRVFSMVLLCTSSDTFAQDLVSLAPFPAPIVQYETTNSEALLQAVLELQGQLRSNQLAIEQ